VYTCGEFFVTIRNWNINQLRDHFYFMYRTLVMCVSHIGGKFAGNRAKIAFANIRMLCYSLVCALIAILDQREPIRWSHGVAFCARAFVYTTIKCLHLCLS